MRALLYQHTDPTKPSAIARIVNGRVEWTGLADPASLMVRDTKTGELLRPDDGERYLECLPRIFRNAYAWVILEDDNFNGA